MTDQMGSPIVIVLLILVTWPLSLGLVIIFLLVHFPGQSLHIPGVSTLQ